MNTTDNLFTGWGFLTFPLVGGLVGLVVLHIIRILCWTRLHNRYMAELEGWTWKHTAGIILFDEVIWLMVFVTAFALLLTLL